MRLLQHLNFPTAALVTLLLADSSLQKGRDQLPREGRADDAPAQDEHVHVVVLDALMRGVCIVTQARSDPGQFVCRDAGANAAPANQDAPFHAAFSDRSPDSFGIIRIIHGFRPVSSEIRDVVAKRAHELRDGLLEREPSVIRGHSDAQP